MTTDPTTLLTLRTALTRMQAPRWQSRWQSRWQVSWRRWFR